MSTSSHLPPELAVIVPTFNERDNVKALIAALETALKGLAWEVVFVDDDSHDGTADLVRQIAQQNGRVRIVQRIGRRGLSSACVEGMLASSAPYLAVIDGDLQHDETRLPEMLRRLKEKNLDIVIGSRYVPGGGTGDWDASRLATSRLATRLSRLIVKSELNDPMSGFFMLRRETLEATMRRLSGIGFKILLDIFASSPRPLRFEEVPYTFRNRHAGESKLDTMVAWEYLMLLLDKLIGHIVPVRFVLFAMIGGIGVFVHLGVLGLLYRIFGTSFEYGQATATLVAMTTNFILNNIFTYRDQRLRGRAFIRGLLSFYLACSLGAVANVGIGFYLFERDQSWWLSGLAGALAGAVLNYALTSVFTWGRPKPGKRSQPAPRTEPATER